MRPRPYIPLLFFLILPAVAAAALQDTLARRGSRYSAVVLPDSLSSNPDSLSSIPDSLASLPDSVIHYPLPPLWGSIRPPAPASVLTGDSLRWISGRWTGESLALSGSLRSFDPSAEGGYAQFYARGSDQRGIGFFRNGRPINEPGSDAFNPYHLQWEECAQVEIVTGPRAFLYGLDHPAATVNFVSREWNANKPFTRILYAEGGDEYGYSDGTFAQNISRRVGVTAGFQHIGAEGAFTNSAHEQWNVRGSVRVHLAPGWLASLSEQYATTQTGLNGGVDLARSGSRAFDPTGATVVNSDSYEKRDRHDLDLSIVESSIDDSSVTTRLTLYHTDSFREYRDEENRDAPNGIMIASNHRMRRSGIEGSRIFSAGTLRIEAAAGVENLRTVESPNLGRQSSLRYSARGLAELTPSPGARLALFARVERGLTETGMGLGGDCSFEILPGVTAFGGVSRSDRLPGMWEQYWSDSTVMRPIPLVKERHTLFEAGLEARIIHNTSLRLALFQRTVKSPVRVIWYGVGSPFGRFTIVNGEELSTLGIDASFSSSFWFVLIEGSGTFHLSSTGEGPANRFPKTSLSGGIYCRGSFFDGSLDVRAGVRGRYVSSASADRFNPEALAWGEDYGAGLGAWSSADGVLSAKIGAAHIHLVWENLTNVSAFTARYAPLRQRGIRFGLAWEFLN